MELKHAQLTAAALLPLIHLPLSAKPLLPLLRKEEEAKERILSSPLEMTPLTSDRLTTEAEITSVKSLLLELLE